MTETQRYHFEEGVREGACAQSCLQHAARQLFEAGEEKAAEDMGALEESVGEAMGKLLRLAERKGLDPDVILGG